MGCLRDMLQKEVWQAFYEYKVSEGCLTKKETEELYDFIQDERYLTLVEDMLAGQCFGPPKKSVLSKNGSSKKRIVYIYPYEENTLLKMLAWKLQEYDGIFSDSLYSFRKGNGVKDAMKRLCSAQHKPHYSVKNDISNYFNSIPVEPMIAMIEKALDEPELIPFLKAHLRSPYVLWKGQVIEEEKGVMAGTPISPFLANLYLKDLDDLFADTLYARYSDDIIFFSETWEEGEEKHKRLVDFLKDKGLSLNMDKQVVTKPGEPWTFLGITYDNGERDISEVALNKLKGKLRRRARALERWKRRKHAGGEEAVRAYLRAVNRKLYHNPRHSELTWTRWYYPLINNEKSLRQVDRYIQTQARYVMFGHHGKKTYNLRYHQLKELGFRSLVHEYYIFRNQGYHSQE